MKTKRIQSFSLTTAIAAATIAVNAQDKSEIGDAPPPPDRKIKYSPYPEENFPNQVFFGDTHLHTGYSTDAGMVGCTLGPEDAYRFARGETVTSSHGLPARLQRPYDFLVVSDHSENLGLATAIAESNPELLKNEWGKMQHDLVKSGIEGGIKAYDNWMALTAKREDPLKEMTEFSRTMWQREIAAAEKYNEPGRFTAFIGYEWTSMPTETISIGTSSSATAGTRSARSFPSPNTTVSTLRICGNGCLPTSKRLAARSSPFHTTAISPAD